MLTMHKLCESYVTDSPDPVAPAGSRSGSHSTLQFINNC